LRREEKLDTEAYRLSEQLSRNTAMQPLLTYRGTVYPWHCDHIGHMNNMWFAGKFDEASWNFLLQLGITPSYLRDTNKGMAAVEQSTSFRRELRAGDSVEVRTQLVEVRERVIRFVHVMFNAETGEECASCAITGVHVDMGTRRACAFADLQRRMAMDMLEGVAAAA
jgi:acyl-CoA thioester hydrolase